MSPHLNQLFSPEDLDLAQLLCNRTALIDVRAPIEYVLGKIPGAVNLPLLDDDQRAQIGTEYKRYGSDAAVAMGHRLIAGETRSQRIETWRDFIARHPGAQIYCFRGGLRSQLTAQALSEAGIDVPIVRGGYKRFRRFAISALERATANAQFVVISGFTGAGKTDLLHAVDSEFQICDLEGAARHRGSAFGGLDQSQSSQADFENALASGFITSSCRYNGPVLIEDESRTIGRSVIPLALFQRLTTAPMLVLERPRLERAKSLIHTYLTSNFGLNEGTPDPEGTAKAGRTLSASLKSIERRLGGAAFKAIEGDMISALKTQAQSGYFDAHEPWVSRLLELYYDPQYLYHLNKNTERVAARGPAQELLAYLRLQLAPLIAHRGLK